MRILFASEQLITDKGTSLFSPHSPPVAARLCLMRLCPSPGTSTQEEMGPIRPLPQRETIAIAAMRQPPK
ncbi:hypothetical protein VZT92_012741 [Zoarces viviparus]|uniref:Uncharacterized protein n=1 Tax=Zoarces viviparus TaxID=48416 RepID=A0AAW1F2P2_ZOAVI